MAKMEHSESNQSIKKIMEGNEETLFAIYKDSANNCFIKFEGAEEKQIQKFEYDEMERYKEKVFNQKMKS